MKLILIGVLTAFSCCSSRHIVTVWKAFPVYQKGFKQVLVVAILPEKDSVLKKQIENEVARNLINLGYPAISALETFGAKGLSNMEEETTYIKLCTSGIDLVLTIAFMNQSKDKYNPGKVSLLYPGSYYYKRIWNYKNTMAAEKNDSSDFFYESILFDLASLQPISVFRTPPFDESENIKISNDLTKNLLRKMLKEKILTTQTTSASPRPF
ncbi:MAG: hypothetical protein ACXWWC_07400 [Chitinophagaceae bacterium]